MATKRVLARLACSAASLAARSSASAALRVTISCSSAGSPRSAHAASRRGAAQLRLRHRAGHRPPQPRRHPPGPSPGSPARRASSPRPRSPRCPARSPARRRTAARSASKPAAARNSSPVMSGRLKSSSTQSNSPLARRQTGFAVRRLLDLARRAPTAPATRLSLAGRRRHRRRSTDDSTAFCSASIQLHDLITGSALRKS